MFMVLTVSKDDEVPQIRRSTFDTLGEAEERYKEEIASGHFTSVRMMVVLKSWSNWVHIDPATNSPINAG